MLSCRTFRTSVAQVTSLSSRTLAGKLGLILHVPSQHRSVSQEANWVCCNIQFCGLVVCTCTHKANWCIVFLPNLLNRSYGGSCHMKQAVSQKQTSLKWYDQVIPYSAQMHNNKAVGIKPACLCICCCTYLQISRTV